MNKKNFIKGTTLPVALFFTIATFAPAWGLQTASAAIEVVQQQSTIKGTVVDSQGEPIIGASVLAEGTSNGTITDIDGVFRINVRPGAKLKVSFIGYTDKKVVAKNDMKVILVEDVTALEEVEIVAYGTQKKVTMTGAIASVKGEELTRVSVGSVSNVLGGQMTGLTRVDDLLLSAPDIMPTVLGLCGLGDSIPAEVQGRNFAPLFFDEKAEIVRPTGALYIQNVDGDKDENGLVQTYFPSSRGIKTAQYTLALYIDRDTKQLKKSLLFDDVKDPYQLHNLPLEENKEIVAQLCGEMGAMLKEINDPWYTEKILSDRIPY